MDAIRIVDHGPDQCVAKVGARNVAYVCYGDGMPINWLPKSASGVRLTDAEKLEAAKQIRKIMANRTKVADDVSRQLDEISGRNYKAKEDDATKQRPDSKGEGKPTTS